MTPYLITTNKFSTIEGIQFGVTAHNEQDALRLFKEAFGTDYEYLGIAIIESIEDLDEGHIRPNMGNFFHYGIWYPRMDGRSK